MDHFRSRRVGRRKVRGHLLEALRSLGGFCLGLLLATSFGVTAFFLQKHELWFCVHSTLAIATLAAFGMGLSANVRTTVMLMFPTLCSEKGRKLVLFLVLSVLLAGPLTNTMENFERAADSVICGAELARNQTQELMRRAAAPLLPVLDRIREITSNTYALSGRVHNFINALTENVRHVARTLRNVIHFLVDIGDVCNAKLSTPHRKCMAVFDEAKEDCTELLGIFNFLCDIVDGLRPLCGLTRAVQLFCVIPSYIAAHLRKRLAAPTVAAFERMKQEFEFNISASMTFDLDVNSSRSLQQVSQEIMEEVSYELGRFQVLKTPLAWGSLLLLAISFFKALQYRRRYLSQDDFDNIYLSKDFVDLDQRRAAEHRDSVLPLSRRETSTYITPLSLTLRSREWQAAALNTIAVLRHMTLGGLLVAQDLLVFWMLDLIYQQVQGGLIARAPFIVEVQVNGSGYASDILKDVVSSFNILQSGNITILSKKCLLEPSEPDYTGYITIGFLYGLALLLALTGGYVQRCRRLICARYYPRREQERIQFLHNHILSQRRCLGRALQASVTRTRADDGGGTEGRGLLLTLLRRAPGGSYLSDLLGMSVVACGVCGETMEERHQLSCLNPQCKGRYCDSCVQSLGNMCTMCMTPLIYQSDSQEELDSSEDEELSTHHTSRQKTRKMSSAAQQRSPSSQQGMSEPLGDTVHTTPTGHIGNNEDDPDISGDISLWCWSENSQEIVTNQRGFKADRSDSPASFCITTSERSDSFQSLSLQTVIVHRSDSPEPTQTPPSPTGTSTDWET